MASQPPDSVGHGPDPAGRFMTRTSNPSRRDHQFRTELRSSFESAASARAAGSDSGRESPALRPPKLRPAGGPGRVRVRDPQASLVGGLTISGGVTVTRLPVPPGI